MQHAEQNVVAIPTGTAAARYAGLPGGHHEFPPVLGQPYSTAQNFVRAYYTLDYARTLHFWQGDFYLYRFGAWSVMTKEDVRAEVYRYIKHVAEPTRSFVDNVMDGLRAFVKILDATQPPAWLFGGTGDPRTLIACRNGLLRFEDRQLLPATARYFTLNALSFDYVPGLPPPKEWLKFLSDVWPDDADSIATLQEMFGYLLTLDTRQQKAFLIVGPKRSGKGTIGRVLRELVGPRNVTAPTLATIGQQFGLQDLIGKQLALISDARLGGRADIAAVAENILRISGEDAISVPRKFLPDYTSQLPVRFVIMTNELPALADASGALASRFIVLRMTRSFYGEEDKGLIDRLLPELPAILDWALDGLERLRQRGYFLQPKSAQSLLEDLEAMSSPVKAFVTERCILSPSAQTPISEIYGAWATWCQENGRDGVGNTATFGARITSAFPQLRVVQLRRDGVRVRAYEGIRLRGAADA